MFLFEQFITNIPFSKIKYEFYSDFRQVVNNINIIELDSNILNFLIFICAHRGDDFFMDNSG